MVSGTDVGVVKNKDELLVELAGNSTEETDPTLELTLNLKSPI